MSHSIFEGNIGSSAVHNHRMVELTNAFLEESDLYAGSARFYEVIRCIDGIPLFLEDHILRLFNSMLAAEALEDTERAEKLTEKLKDLISDINIFILFEGIVEGNIKIVLTEEESFVFASDFFYPPESYYEKGVHTGLLEWERDKPNVKRVVDDYKKAVAQKLDSPGPYGFYFESLLHDEKGLISEGSRSNAFFLVGDKFVTAPEDMVLKGITRKYMIEAISRAGYELDFACVTTEDLKDKVEAAFLSGTSIGLLPISDIEDRQLDSAANEKIQAVMKGYNEIVNEYLNSKI